MSKPRKRCGTCRYYTRECGPMGNCQQSGFPVDGEERGSCCSWEPIGRPAKDKPATQRKATRGPRVWGWLGTWERLNCRGVWVAVWDRWPTRAWARIDLRALRLRDDHDYRNIVGPNALVLRKETL